jgi:hypothetical protein
MSKSQRYDIWHNRQKWLVKSCRIQWCKGFEGSLPKMVSVNFFCFMKSSKKSGAGPVVLHQFAGGENVMVNRDLSARIAAFCLPEMLLDNEIRTALFGLKSGF